MSTMEERMASTEGRMAEVERTLARIAAINREMQATNREMQEDTRRLREENDRFSEENRRFSEESRASFRRLQEENRVSLERLQEERYAYARETQERHRVLEAQTVAFREEVRQSQRQWGELANKMGTLVEDIVAPGIPAVFQIVFGWDRLEDTFQRMRRRHVTDRARVREFDYVVVSGNLVLITETKSTLRPDDLPTFLATLRDARDYLPEHTGKQFVGALASFSVDPSLVVAGERQGLLMFGLGTGLLEILNTPGFQPTRF